MSFHQIAPGPDAAITCGHQVYPMQDDSLRERLKANEQQLQNLDIDDLDAGEVIRYPPLSGIHLFELSCCP